MKNWLSKHLILAWFLGVLVTFVSIMAFVYGSALWLASGADCPAPCDAPGMIIYSLTTLAIDPAFALAVITGSILVIYLGRAKILAWWRETR